MSFARLPRKFEALIRLGMVHGLSGLLPLYIVNEYPKSGGTWVAQMLGCALGLPFPRNRTPKLEASIMQGHYLNSWGMNNVVLVWRDGRDVMISLYYHCLFYNDLYNAPLVHMVRKDLPLEDYEDVRKNLPAFIEYSFTRHRTLRFSWSDFVRSWHTHEDAVHVRYEDLHYDTAGELRRIVRELTGEQLDLGAAAAISEEFSFSKQTGRERGEENKRSFMRKGVVGDWRNHFSREAREVFDHYAGRELMQLGYESGDDWVERADGG